MRLLNVAVLALIPLAGSVVADGLQSVLKDRIEPCDAPSEFSAAMRK